jgi:RNA polymerase sigma factor (TIGR02999 family)
MNAQSPEPLTVLLRKAAEGDRQAENAVFEQLMPHLRAIAGSLLQNEQPGATLQATMLVNEAYLRQRLGSQVCDSAESRQHLLNTMARIMRRILIDRARKKGAIVHGGGWASVELDDIDIPAEREIPAEQMGAFDQALDALRREDPVAADVVEMKLLLGMTNEQIALALDIGVTTVKKKWNYGKARLFTLME